MKNKVRNPIFCIMPVLLALVLTFIFFCMVCLKNISKTDDYQPLTISKVINGPALISFVKGNVYKTSFRAISDNLGSVTFRFDTKHYMKKDYLLFQIKEHSANEWYYSNPYRTDWFQDKMLYPFGFPIIQNSKNKIFDIRLSSLNGTVQNNVRLNSPQYITKYIYKKSDVRSIPKLYFLFSEKMKSVTNNIQISQWAFISFPLSLYFFGYVININNRKKYDTMLEHAWFGIKKAFQKDSIMRWTRFYELMTVYYILYFFFFSYYVSKTSTPVTIKVLLFLPFIKFIVNLFQNSFLEKTGSFIKNNVLFLFLMELFVLFELLFIHDNPTWDAAANFRSLVIASKQLSPFFLNFLDVFNWYGHPVHGYGSYMAIGQFFFPGSNEVMHVQNILLGIIALFSFYRILTSHFSIKSAIAALSTFLLGINPLFISLSNSTNLDYPALCFFIIALSCLLSDKFILFTFFSIMALFSKEISIILFGQLYLAALIVYFIQKKRIWTKSLTYLFIPFIVFGIYLYLSNGRVWEANYYLVPKQPFVFDKKLILVRLFEVFVLNFNWLLMVIIILGGIFHFFKMKKIVPIGSNMAIMSLTFLFFLCFMLPYNTFTHPRYIGVTLPFIFVFFAVSMNSLNIKSSLKTAFLCIFGVLLAISIFLTIDPLSKEVFGTYTWGKYKILSIGDTIQSRCDSMVYNMQYVMIGRLFKKFTEVERPKSDSIIYVNMSASLYYREGKWLIQFFSSIPIYSLEEWQTYRSNDASYYLELPWIPFTDEKINKDIIKNNFVIKKERTINLNGYWMKYYKLDAHTSQQLHKPI